MAVFENREICSETQPRKIGLLSQKDRWAGILIFDVVIFCVVVVVDVVALTVVAVVVSNAGV